MAPEFGGTDPIWTNNLILVVSLLQLSPNLSLFNQIEQTSMCYSFQLKYHCNLIFYYFTIYGFLLNLIDMLIIFSWMFQILLWNRISWDKLQIRFHWNHNKFNYDVKFHIQTKKNLSQRISMNEATTTDTSLFVQF